MQYKKNNNKHFQKAGLFAAVTLTGFFYATASMAQGLPPLPPLPPLPGMEAPAQPKVEVAAEELKKAAEETVKEAAAEAQEANQKLEQTLEAVPTIEPMPAPGDTTVAGEDMFAIPEIPDADGEIAMPDFGLFDPAALPGNGNAEVELPTIEQAAPELPPIPAVDDSTAIADSMEAPELPPLPGFPSLDEPIEPVTPPVVAEVKPVEEPKTDETIADLPAPKVEPKESVAELEAPSLPESKPLTESLAEALPSWMTDETLPSLKPMPQDKDVVNTEPAKSKTANIKQDKIEDSAQSLADVIDKEINSGESYGEESASLDDIVNGAEGDDKRVVWPKNFKTQRLPPEVYHKGYSNANRHLPHALYQKEIQAHLFSAVGANDGDAVRALLRTGVPLNIRNAMGEDLVMHAVKTGATTTLQLVLALGAAPSIQDRYGATPLHRAVFMGRQDMATILLRAGANTYINDMSGVTPMSIAVARHDQPMMQTLGYYQSSGQSRNNMARYQPY